MIQVEHLTKRYGPTVAVSDVSFEVQKGEVLGFLGPNGAGKTTTMRVITGYLPPTEGKVTVAGFDVVEDPIEAKRRTGYLPETPPVYPDMTVREYLGFVARIKAVPRAEVKNRVHLDFWAADEETTAGCRKGRPCRVLIGFVPFWIYYLYFRNEVTRRCLGWTHTLRG